MKLVNSVFKWYIKQHISKVRRYLEYPVEVQDIWFKSLLQKGKSTVWGEIHSYKDIKTKQDFKEQVPISTYEDLKPFIERMMMGEPDVLWPGVVKWFSKSSGTTSAKSKYIPVTDENLKECHLRGAHDVMSSWYVNNDAKIFEGKNLVMGGSFHAYEHHKDTLIGDVSAIMIEHMPAYARFFNTPDIETTLMSNYEEKLERMVKVASKEDVTTMIGVPTWTLLLFQKILDYTGKKNLLEVWPNFEVYMHGGVSFTPYKQQFQELLPSSKVGYLNVYNASEGFFAAQLENEAKENEMSLLLDNGVYYEFLPVSEMGNPDARTVELEDVEIGQNYAIVVTTNAGLWRYMPGDTVKFTSVFPFKIQITGRTQHHINVFGEEVMVDNTDKAVSMTCSALKSVVKDYTVAPVFMENSQKGGHEWLIEFGKAPDNLEAFAELLDSNLQRVNSDYEAKRFKSLAIDRLKINPVPENTFYNWLKSKGKIGGQHKVPRLSNERVYLEEILAFAEEV